MAKHVWTYNVELDIELAETLRAEIICHATGEAEFLVGVVLAVGNFLEEFSGVLRLELCRLSVRIVDEDDESLLLAYGDCLLVRSEANWFWL